MADEPMLTVTYEVPLSRCKALAKSAGKHPGGTTGWTPNEKAQAAAYRKWEQENLRYRVRESGHTGWVVLTDHQPPTDHVATMNGTLFPDARERLQEWADELNALEREAGK